MKKRSVVWRDWALDNLGEILAYIGQDNPVAALQAVDKIEKAGNNLGNFATSHFGRVGNTYEIGVSGLPYIIAYAVETQADGGETTVILRVIHGARNWPARRWPE